MAQLLLTNKTTVTQDEMRGKAARMKGSYAKIADGVGRPQQAQQATAQPSGRPAASSAQLGAKPLPRITAGNLVRAGGAVMAAKGAYDMAQNPTLSNAVTAGTGAVTAANPVAGGALTAGLVAGRAFTPDSVAIKLAQMTGFGDAGTPGVTLGPEAQKALQAAGATTAAEYLAKRKAAAAAPATPIESAPATPKTAAPFDGRALLAGRGVPQPGQGAMRNDRTGAITTFNSPPVPMIAGNVPAQPEQDGARISMPTLGTQGGIFQNLANFAGQYAQAAQQIGQTNQGRRAANDAIERAKASATIDAAQLESGIKRSEFDARKRLASGDYKDEDEKAGLSILAGLKSDPDKYMLIDVATGQTDAIGNPIMAKMPFNTRTGEVVSPGGAAASAPQQGYPEGTRLTGADGKAYIVKGGKPVLVQ